MARAEKEQALFPLEIEWKGITGNLQYSEVQSREENKTPTQMRRKEEKIPSSDIEEQGIRKGKKEGQ